MYFLIDDSVQTAKLCWREEQLQLTDLLNNFKDWILASFHFHVEHVMKIKLCIFEVALKWTLLPSHDGEQICYNKHFLWEGRSRRGSEIAVGDVTDFYPLFIHMFPLTNHSGGEQAVWMLRYGETLSPDMPHSSPLEMSFWRSEGTACLFGCKYKWVLHQVLNMGRKRSHSKSAAQYLTDLRLVFLGINLVSPCF